LKGPDKFAFVPRTTKPTKEESLELFGLFLDFIGKHSQQFDLWIRVLKHQFLTTLYPSIAKQLGWIDKNDSTILLLTSVFFFLFCAYSHFFSNCYNIFKCEFFIFKNIKILDSVGGY
jgi:hypothetical protein